MPTNGNGKFLRGVFWALLIGSFGWATAFGMYNLVGMDKHCSEAKAEFTCVRQEMVSRDETTLDKITQEFKTLNTAMARVETEIKYIRRAQGK